MVVVPERGILDALFGGRFVQVTGLYTWQTGDSVIASWGASLTINLPALSSVPVGTAILAGALGLLTFQPAAGDDMDGFGAGASRSFSAAGTTTSAIVVSLGTRWMSLLHS